MGVLGLLSTIRQPVASSLRSTSNSARSDTSFFVSFSAIINPRAITSLCAAWARWGNLPRQPADPDGE